MPWYYDLYKFFTYAFEDDPLSKKSNLEKVRGAGIHSSDALSMRQDASGAWGGANPGFIRVNNDLVDLSAFGSRISRYKEYDKLRTIPEIEMVMNSYADEACISGKTLVATLLDGFKTIEWLAKNKKDEEFLVYCWDFKKNDFSLGWAFDPRKVKTAQTVEVVFSDGTYLQCTPDHRVLMSDGSWRQAIDIKQGEELVPFYKLQPNPFHNDLKNNLYPRIYTFSDGWKHERQFVDEWKSGKPTENKKLQTVNSMLRMIAAGITTSEISRLLDRSWKTLQNWMNKEGFTHAEISYLSKKKPTTKRVVGVIKSKEIDVYDLSVKDHENFCTDVCVVHNCQKGETNHVFEIKTKNDKVKKELEYLFFNRNRLNMDRRIWGWFKESLIMGDSFFEMIVDTEDPKAGIVDIAKLPPESMFRIETTKGKLLEFQQSKDGPNYDLLAKPVNQLNDAELMQENPIRFRPEQIIHIKLGDDRKSFYPYGQSLIEPARGPAHQLRLMEDAMVVYRLSRAAERRIFYIDIGTLPPFKAEALVDRIKDQFRKKKVGVNKGGTGTSAIEERWNPQSLEEDIWLPTRPNSATRVDVLPGAQNIDQVSDVSYFRNKVFMALGYPPTRYNAQDVNQTRITLSAQDVNVAKLIERLQGYWEDGLLEVAIRHLYLTGIPEEEYDDLMIVLTPPSAWKELSEAEVKTNRINNAGSLKGAMLLSDFDILTRWMKYSDEEAKDFIARNKIQKLEDLKMQILAQNPGLYGIGTPGDDANANEISTEPGANNPMIGPNGPEQPPEEAGGAAAVPQNPEGGPPQPKPNAHPLPEPDAKDIKNFDLDIQNFAAERNREEIDYSELD